MFLACGILKIMKSNKLFKGHFDMKKINKENVLFVLSIIAFVFFLLLSVVYNVWIEENNKSLKSVTLSDATLNDGVYSFSDFDVKAGVRGGDASAWLKDLFRDIVSASVKN